MMENFDVRFRLILLIAILLCAIPAAGAKAPSGQFAGEIVATLLSDGRNLKLEKGFAYIDPDGTRWDVPAGAQTDGASVPRAFWLAYPPFTGKYRQAAVVHDYYCRTRKRSWRATHKVFYDAMITAGVGDVTAKMMYGAVYYMGPRWGFGSKTRGPGAEKLVGEKQQLDFMKRLEAWIKRENPGPNEIATAMESGRIP